MNKGVIATAIIVSVIGIGYMTIELREAERRDDAKRHFLSQYRYGDTTRIDRGFYKGCVATLYERESFYTFKGKLKCGDDTIAYFEQRLDARTFSAYINVFGEE